MRFKIGEKVTFMHESGYGVVLSYKDANCVIVEDESGFDREFLENELVKILGDHSGAIANSYDKDGYEMPDNYGQTSPRGLTKSKDFWEIDLHSHMIMDSERGLSNGQILTRQLYEFKRSFKEAKMNLIRKLVVIHGVGEGVLKTEIREYLSGQLGIEFYDASFREYGKGATEIRIYYKQ